MEIEDLADRLKHHESSSQSRFETLHHAITEGKKMADTPHVKNVFSPVENPLGMMGGYGGLGGAGAGAGAGLGAGLLGGVLGGALLGNRGLFGANGEGVRNHVTPEQLQSAIAGLNDSNQNSLVLQDLGAIKGMIPASEGALQLAMSQSQNAISNQIGQQSISLVQGFAGVNQNVSAAQAAVIAVGESVKDAVNLNSSAIQLSIANNTAQGLQNTNAIMTAVRDDGDKTRALIVSQNEATLTRQLAVAEAALLESRNESRARGTEVTVTQNVNQNNLMQQQQQQQQQQLLLLNSIAGHLVGLQNAVATNSNMIIGNTGSVGTGTQTANPINVAR